LSSGKQLLLTAYIPNFEKKLLEAHQKSVAHILDLNRVWDVSWLDLLYTEAVSLVSILVQVVYILAVLVNTQLMQPKNKTLAESKKLFNPFQSSH
jgi:hypothetical protein